MKAKFIIGETVYYKREIPNTNPPQYLIRRGLISYIHITASTLAYKVETASLGLGFTLQPHELYKSQKAALKSLKCSQLQSQV